MRVIAPRVDKRGIGQLADNRQIGRISRTQYHDTEIVYVNECELDVNAHKIKIFDPFDDLVYSLATPILFFTKGQIKDTQRKLPYSLPSRPPTSSTSYSARQPRHTTRAQALSRTHILPLRPRQHAID